VFPLLQRGERIGFFISSRVTVGQPPLTLNFQKAIYARGLAPPSDGTVLPQILGSIRSTAPDGPQGRQDWKAAPGASLAVLTFASLQKMQMRAGRLDL
jgi:hypothetical protein